MTTVQQDAAFLKAVLPERLLEASIDWIAKNMEPEDVFSEKELREWADSMGLTESE